MADENPDQTEEAPPPQAVVMQMVMGAWVSNALSAVTRLDVPDLLKEHGPQTALQLTEQHGVDAVPDFLERLLRACASVDVFTEDADGRFGPTPLSDVLTIDSPVSAKKLTEMFGASFGRVWNGFGDAVRTGLPQAKAQLGMEYWDYCNANPQEMEDFGEAMKSNSARSLQGVLEKCDLSGARRVVDVGGGFGHLAAALLEKYAHLNAVVMDVPAMIPIARERLTPAPEVADRLEYVGGDMFESVPAGDVYIMKHIIHDWDDARSTRLLRRCRDAMEGDGRVICVDAVLPPMGETAGVPAKFLDLNIMVFIPGKERTREQWDALYSAAGMKIVSVTPIADNFGTSIIEGVKA